MLKPTKRDIPASCGPELIQFLRRPEVSRITGLPTSTIYQMMASGTFPKNFRISARLCAWRADEVAAWQKAKLASRESAAA
ncbi:helix-turn-helix transcriptional regulator [Methylocystis rosea]|uniref:helix-turn-helix transcriptional regulator n=1 Tax=Methylocystis rosea TaxID=173366 RepID=UPI000378B614|nr:AlpA family phage regulatory protein [Methylocystis rosea]